MTTPRSSRRSGLAAGTATLLTLLAAPGPSAAATDPPSQAAAPGPAPPVEEVLVTAPEPRFVAPTTRDRIGRIWAPVMVNGRGPYRLVLDTGASRSALSQRVVDELGLPLRRDTVRLRGVTGTAVVASVRLDSLEFGELAIEDTIVPVVADAFGGAEGVLGGEGLDGKRIRIEFRRDRISIARSSRLQAPPGYSVVPFTHSTRRGMRIEVMVGPVKTVGLVDTGAQMTVGNLALREALARRRDRRDTFDEAVIGVTEDVQQATRVAIPSITAGQLIVRNAEIMFSDLYIFEHWRLTSRPALLIGMDVLGVLDTLVIDYARDELQIRTRQ